MFSHFIRILLSIPENRIKRAVRNIFYGEIISERIVEYALTFAHLGVEPSRKTRILDIGCYFSNFPIQLASMGYKVTAIDLMEYQLTHPNFNFIQGDLLKQKFPKSSFDIVTCISTLEHMGLGFYKGDKKDFLADSKALKIIYSILKKRGRLILTVPFGKKETTSIQRVYDWNILKEILKDFKIEKTLFYKEERKKWLLTDKKEAAKVKSGLRTRAMAFVVATRS